MCKTVLNKLKKLCIVNRHKSFNFQFPFQNPKKYIFKKIGGIGTIALFAYLI